MGTPSKCKEMRRTFRGEREAGVPSLPSAIHNDVVTSVLFLISTRIGLLIAIVAQFFIKTIIWTVETDIIPWLRPLYSVALPPFDL